MDLFGREGDYLDRMRGLAAVALSVAVIFATLGSFLDWAHISEGTKAPPAGGPGAAPILRLSVRGIETGDGWWVLGASAIILLAAVFLVLRKRSLYAWISFLATAVMGSLVFADFRGIGDLAAAISAPAGVVGKAEPAIGLILVAVAVFVAVVGSLVGVAASPRQPDAL
jgi:hypothetical protein